MTHVNVDHSFYLSPTYLMHSRNEQITFSAVTHTVSWLSFSL